MAYHSNRTSPGGPHDDYRDYERDREREGFEPYQLHDRAKPIPRAGILATITTIRATEPQIRVLDHDQDHQAPREARHEVQKLTVRIPVDVLAGATTTGMHLRTEVAAGRRPRDLYREM